MSNTAGTWHEAADSALSAKRGQIDPETLNMQSRSLFDNLTAGELEEMVHLTLLPPAIS